MLILNCYNANFEISPVMKQTLGKIRFSVLVQEILSMAIFIPIMMLSRQIFRGISDERYARYFLICTEVLDGI